MGWNIDDCKYNWTWGNGDWGKFSHTYAYPISGGLTLDGLKRASESINGSAIKHLFIVEEYLQNNLEDVIESFGVVYVGTSIEDVEGWLQSRLQNEDIEEDMQYMFDVYQFPEKDEPKVVGNYILNNWELFKRIGEHK